MLREAKELLAGGHDLAAVLLARASVDAHLRGLLMAVSHKAPGCKANRTGAVRGALLRAGVISPEQEAWLERKLRVANRAAHGVPFDHGQLAAFVRFAGAVLEEIGKPAGTGIATHETETHNVEVVL